MKISATAQGGFAGIGEHYEVDTSTHPGGKALEAALAGQQFFQAADGAPAVGADMRRWTITADDDGHVHSVSFYEDGRPDSQRWQSLLNHIRAAA